jgi:hypothetical protein
VQQELQHDLRLRAAASVIYDAVYPGPEWSQSALTRQNVLKPSIIVRRSRLHCWHGRC